MIKLFSVKDKAKKAAGDGTEVNKPHRLAACELRLQKDLAELALPPNISIRFPDGPEKLTHFELIIRPVEGIYRGGNFVFDFQIPSGYPHEAPKGLCKTKVYHPNIDLEGKICLNILREDWKPVLSVTSVIHGLHFLFLDPNPEDPLNKEAAQAYQENPKSFEAAVQRSIMHGTSIAGQHFPACHV
mmetsp:Transcript_11542/g.20492  ORF Transcript_11542/g.20492 Transcript_11542/m.20492 type:complete len:186 (-) Transcript_11542:778-1335(-)|eukprot:CAMPEP_0119108594 /NCGR_PEP_ID=MMETSP1180-20130426/15301_1 /TAXON_ID=3052 ORGANISM="Chlamydomonas cf sp, Strain CCMP681" /NCGR_SAMPLE_ID=MMETSP1180 /ASSEMBLY_ACC=CAM_ASM_000741 /LENGTH=185 /DNA_ID=CAMNT_0007094223 /DNA_START=111 /DNA_END=668 /DNA_ORIENTATION=+